MDKDKKMSEEHKKKGKNYTEREKQNLLLLVKRYERIIENKRTDGATIKEKSRTWEIVTNEFNKTAESGVRGSSQLKSLYKNMKSERRKAKAAELKLQNLTSEGCFNEKLENNDSRVLNLFERNIVAEEKIYDSDILYHSIDNKTQTIPLPIENNAPLISTSPEPQPMPVTPEKIYPKIKKKKIIRRARTSEELKRLYFQKKIVLANLEIKSERFRHFSDRQKHQLDILIREKTLENLRKQ